MIKNLMVQAGFIFLAIGALLLSSCSKKYSEVKIIQTSKSGDKLSTKDVKSLQSRVKSELPVIRIQPDQTYQKIIGFGGAFTESSAHVLNQLSPKKRMEVIDAYFSPDRAGYSLTRTHINSCDFSLSYYAYTSQEDGKDLSNFSVEEDEDDVIPFIHDAQNIEGANFKIIASPWTAPPWMKDNNDWIGGSLLPEYYDTWARYFCKYIEAYKQHNIPIWGVTVENEPLGNGDNWESMIYTPEEMADFVKNNLGPQFEKNNIDAKILVYDQNRDELEEWADKILSDQESAKYIWGTAVHWYSSTYDWYPETLDKVHQQFPDKKLLHTEGCIDAEVPVWQDDEWYWSKEATDWGYDWASEENKHMHPKYVPTYRYARDIIGGLNSHLVGWIDWNMVLNSKGGPNHAQNWCIAPVIAKPDKNQVYYTPLYYVMAHFSKFIRPGALRLGIQSDIDGLMATAVKNPDNSIVVEILNQNESRRSFNLNLNNKSVEISISGSTLQTLIIQ